MRLRINDYGNLLKSAYNEWNKKDPFRQSAVIAYYAIFSIPGLLILVITIVGYFFDKEAISKNILAQITGTMGADISEQIQQMLLNASKTKNTVWGSLIGIGTILLGATGVFVELQITLNAIWEVKVVPNKGFSTFLKSRLFSFGLILAVAFLLMVSLVISTAISWANEQMIVYLPQFTIVIFNIINVAFSIAVISMLFALMFKILPDAKIKWNHVWLGALITSFLFTLGKNGLAYYFSQAKPGSVYGAAGTIILMLLWVSYSSMILFFGAEFTAAYAKKVSGTIAPTVIAKAETELKANKNI